MKIRKSAQPLAILVVAIGLALPFNCELRAAELGELLFTLSNPRPPIPGFTNGFATGVTIAGGKIFVGATFDDAVGLNAGSVDIYDASSGTYLDSILNPFPNTNSNFGAPLTTVHDQLIVGHPLGSGDGASGWARAGRVYRYEPTTHQQLGGISAPIPQFDANFGNSVAPLGDNIAVGAPKQTPGGAAYVVDGFDNSIKLQIANPSPHNLDRFGQSVSSFDGKILVGAPGFDSIVNSSQDVGRAYIFNGDTGALIGTVENPIQAGLPNFGLKFGNQVQGLGHNFAVLQDSEIDLFNGSTLELIRPLLSSANIHGAGLGLSFAQLGNDLLVGAQSLESVFLFDGNDGSLLWTLNNPDPVNHSHFGMSVTANSDKIVIGAFEAAYVFQVVPEPPSFGLATIALPAVLLLAARKRWQIGR